MNTTPSTNNSTPCLLCRNGRSAFGDECAKCNGTGQVRTAGVRSIDRPAPTLSGASDAQITLLAKLAAEMADTDHEASVVILAAMESGLTKKAASDVITYALAAAKAARTAKPKAATESLEGFWTLEGDVAKVQRNLAGTSEYGKLLDPDTGSWEYTPGLPGRIRREGWAKLTAEEAGKLGHLYGRCVCCGRTLTDEGSIERGIGPICAAKL